MNGQQYRTFASDAFRRLTELNEKCEVTFKMGSYESWNYDLQSGYFVFSDNDVPKVIANIQVVGSVSTDAGTWLWSWANASIPETVCDELHRVREFGIVNEIAKLTEPKWEAEEEDGWEMAAVVAVLLDGKGAYRCPTKSGPLFVLFTDINFVA
jgi:hypothetical protein